MKISPTEAPVYTPVKVWVYFMVIVSSIWIQCSLLISRLSISQTSLIRGTPMSPWSLAQKQEEKEFGRLSTRGADAHHMPAPHLVLVSSFRIGCIAGQDPPFLARIKWRRLPFCAVRPLLLKIEPNKHEKWNYKHPKHLFSPWNHQNQSIFSRIAFCQVRSW